MSYNLWQRQPHSVSAIVSSHWYLSAQIDRGHAAETATAAMNVSTDTGSGAVPPAAKPVDVQTLMKSDPRFIARLIQQLDSQMHNMQDEKKRRQQAITEDTEEMQRIDQEIKMHVQPGIVEYSAAYQQDVLMSICICVLSLSGNRQRGAVSVQDVAGLARMRPVVHRHPCMLACEVDTYLV